MTPGPLIDSLTRRLAECPADFLAEPRLRGREGGVSTLAVVSDLLEDLGSGRPLAASEGRPWEPPGAQERNRMRLTLVACWLCRDDSFRARGGLWRAAGRFLATGLRPLAELVSAELFVTDPDRREELARALLAALDLSPQGESDAQASDRLKALSSVERAGVIREMRAKEEAARKLREQMAAKAAQQAAARYGSE
jgi:hypothetical protein